MARKRMIDPDFWLDEALTSCDRDTRLFYIGTWNFSDDYGVIENSERRLKAQIFPYDELDLKPLIKKLVGIGCLVPFEAEGKNWLYIKNFLKWQKVEKPSFKRNPAPPSEIIGEESATTPQPVGTEVKRSKVNRSKVNNKPANKFADGSKEILDIFYKTVNPLLNFKNKTEWKAASTLIEKVGKTKALGAAKYATSIQGTKYSPTITKPTQLLNKYGELQAHYAKNIKQSDVAII